MSDGRKYYCMCDSNCKFETMTKEQILTAITQAVETGSVGDVDTGFITKVKEQNGGSCVTFWVGTRAQYNAIETKEQNCMYIITDDTTGADLEKACANAAATAEAALEKVSKNGTIDFTSDVSFSWDKDDSTAATVTNAYITPVYFGYNPYTGLVHFCGFLFYEGQIKDYDTLSFKLSSNPYPSAMQAIPMSIYGFGEGSIKSEGYNTELVFQLRNVMGMENNYAQFSGWYAAKTNNDLG